jgi:hypothetical protein
LNFTTLDVAQVALRWLAGLAPDIWQDGSLLPPGLRRTDASVAHP